LVHTDDPRRRRALLMLGADAEAQAGRHERAARLYIAAAGVPGDGSADSRSKSASMNAAHALARAGLYADAIAVLEHSRALGAHTGRNDHLEQIVRRY